jgi:nucleoside-diphosphate-sugar epimerase
MVGRAVAEKMVEYGQVKAAVRTADHTFSSAISMVAVGDISADTDWTIALQGIDVVIHTAARVHQISKENCNASSAFIQVNVDATLSLARAAANLGVKRFVFISSIKVNGEMTLKGKPFTETSSPRPEDAYAISKYNAECGLREISLATGMEVVVLRLPLVYGPRVKANFLKLMQTIDRGIPLPFGSIANCRSLVYLSNAVNAIALCARHFNAAGRTYLISDQQDVSTPELIKKLAKAMNRDAKLLSIPPRLLFILGLMTGRSQQIQRLLSSLSVDSTALSAELGWQPPFSVEQGLKATADWYQST